MIDKQLLIIIIFLGVTFSLAGILVMGAVPKIFQSADKINQTQEIVNETLLQQHEDQARLNQTIHEDQARRNQSQTILNETKLLVASHQDQLEKYMVKIFKDNHILLENQENMLKGIGILLNDTVKRIIDNQIKVSKYGTENNALSRAIAEKLGLNVTKVFDEYYIENNITPVHPPPPPSTSNSTKNNNTAN